jgi:hypothetical protein
MAAAVAGINITSVPPSQALHHIHLTFLPHFALGGQMFRYPGGLVPMLTETIDLCFKIRTTFSHN